MRDRQLAAAKPFTCHSDDREPVAVDNDLFAKDTCVPVPIPLPKPLADNRYRIPPHDLIFLGKKIASGGYRDSERPEVITGDHFAHQPLRYILSRDTKRRFGKGGEVAENRRAVTKITIVWIRRITEALIAIGAPDDHQLVSPAQAREWPKKYAVNQGDYGQINSDAKGEREHGDHGEAGVLQQLAEGEFEIIHNAAPPSDRLSPHVGPATTKRATQRARESGRRRRTS